MAERDPVSGALLIRSSVGSTMMNPPVRVAMASAADMVRYSSEFGLTPAARSRISGILVANLAPGNSRGS
jgi:phage terminase small subunit